MLRLSAIKKISVSLAGAAVGLGIWFAAGLGPSVGAAGVVVITGLASNHSAVVIHFNPVPGAKDYRAYDVTSPNNVKYAGMVHLTASTNCPGTYCQNHFVMQGDGVTPVYPYQIAASGAGGLQALDVPSTQIDWNNSGDGAAHTLIVEAVDRLGPVPPGALYYGPNNLALFSPTPGAMLGGNKGPTPDGKSSTNGQGPYTNNPQVIAQSPPFVVKANRNQLAIPSKPTATNTFFDTFDNAENATLTQTARVDDRYDAYGDLGWMKYTLNAGTARAWEIEYRRADNGNSMPFIAGDHFMDMLFDGSTPNTSGGPAHALYSTMAMTPTQTLSMAGGKILHLTMEVDGHQSFRRWLGFNLAPASDPLQGWHSDFEAISPSNVGILLEFKDSGCTLDIFTGTTSPTDPRPTGTAGGPDHGARLWGPAGSFGGAPIMCSWDEMYVAKNFGKNGRGLDDKSRFDFFISQTRAALFQDGQLIVQSAIPAGSFPWANVPLRAYYTHYLYHTDDDVLDLMTYQVNGQSMCYPLNAYWFNDPQTGTQPGATLCNTAYAPGVGFRYSDERHWDNMGFEALASSDAPANDYAPLASLVQPPAIVNGSAPTAPANLRIIR